MEERPGLWPIEEGRSIGCGLEGGALGSDAVAERESKKKRESLLVEGRRRARSRFVREELGCCCGGRERLGWRVSGSCEEKNGQ
jgi:hypothetical protein